MNNTIKSTVFFVLAIGTLLLPSAFALGDSTISYTFPEYDSHWKQKIVAWGTSESYYPEGGNGGEKSWNALTAHIPEDGTYKVSVYFYANSEDEQEHEEFNLYINGVFVGHTTDKNNYTTQILGEKELSAGTYTVRAEHRWHYTDWNSSNSVIPIKVFFEKLENANNPPIANAGPDKAVEEGMSIRLDGDAYDPDGDDITISWDCSGGSLSNNSIEQPYFYAPEVSGDKTYTCSISVEDEVGLTDADFVRIAVLNTFEIEEPAVETDPANNIEKTNARLNGDLEYLGEDSFAEVWFEWGRTTSYGNQTSKQIKTALGDFSRNIFGLREDTLYHFRAVAENSQYKVYGRDRTFRTDEEIEYNNPPVANAGPDKAVEEGMSIRLDGDAYDPDGDDIDINWECESGSLSYRDTERPRYNAPFVSYDKTFTCEITIEDEFGATDSDTMRVRVIEDNREELIVRTLSAQDIEENSATLRGYLTELGGEDWSRVWFEWGETSSYGEQTSKSGEFGSISFEKGITGIKDDTIYHFRAVAYNGEETAYGQDKTFRTKEEEENTDLLDIEKQARNLSRGDKFWNDTIYASSSDIVVFRIKINSESNEEIKNVKVKDSLPSRLVYQGHLKINGENESRDITKEKIELGDLEPDKGIEITYWAMVASKENFNFGVTALTNFAKVYGDNAQEEINSASVFVRKTSVAGISTGLIGNLWLDSILLPLLGAGILVFLLKSKLIGLDKAIAIRKRNIRNYRVKKELTKRAKNIRL